MVDTRVPVEAISERKARPNKSLEYYRDLLPLKTEFV